MTHKIVPEMTYIVSSATLKPTMPYHTFPIHACSTLHREQSLAAVCASDAERWRLQWQWHIKTTCRCCPGFHFHSGSRTTPENTITVTWGVSRAGT